jgi:hypothetical protein
VDQTAHADKCRRCDSLPAAPGSAGGVLRLPESRGEVSRALLDALAQDPHTLKAAKAPFPADPLADEDLQLALYLCYELHYRGLPGVSDEWEWEPSLLALRRQLEARFEAGLLDVLGVPAGSVAAEEIDVALREVEAADEAPSLSRHLERHGTHDEMLEFVVHRSAYQLKEADPHSWALPRLTGAPKAAMVEIQADEYGGGNAERMHAALFAKSMDRLGLDSRYGAYLGRIPGVTLATVNLMSLLGLHRRWRGALVGHLALFEMSSSVPNRRYGNGLRRLGCDAETTDFFDEHVTADAVHEAIAAVDLAGGLVRQDPALSADVIWGARALVELEGRFARRLLEAWEAGRSSLLRPLVRA